MIAKPALAQSLLHEEDEIAILTINRPEVHNAINEGVWCDIDAFIDYLNAAEHIRVGIITGAGKSFIAGGDINCVINFKPLESVSLVLSAALVKIEDSKKPVIAAINGLAYGGGLEIALACDTRIISERARFAAPEAGLGLIPGGGGTIRLGRIVGTSVAKDVVLAGRVLSAEEAITFGLAMKMVPTEEVLPEAIRIAKTMARRMGPVALMMGKRAINISMDTDMKTALYVEALSFGLLNGTKDKVEGTSAFLEKRTPEFKGI